MKRLFLRDEREYGKSFSAGQKKMKALPRM